MCIRDRSDVEVEIESENLEILSKDELLKPRQIKSPADYRPGTTKGKIDAHPIWVVEIMMPKQLIGNMKYGEEQIDNTDATETSANTGGVNDIS